jgi:hypothetical protein
MYRLEIPESWVWKRIRKNLGWELTGVYIKALREEGNPILEKERNIIDVNNWL